MRAEAKQNKEFIHSFPWAGRCSASPGKQGSITRNGDLGRETPSLPMSPPSFFFPQLYILSMTSYGMRYPFGQFGSAVLAVPPPVPASCAPGRAWEAGKVLDWCKHYPATTKTSVCYQYYSHTVAVLKKINSTVAKALIHIFLR